MPVGAYTGPNVSTGNGVATIYPYDFQILAKSDLIVEVNGVAQTVDVDYTVDGVGEPGGGNVTFTVAPANGLEVLRYRERAYERDTDYQRNGSFDEETVDPDFDSLQMQIQQLNAKLARAFKAPKSVSADQVLSSADWAARASKILGFDAAGVLKIFAQADIPLTAVSAFIQALLDDADQDAAAATLGVLRLTGGTMAEGAAINWAPGAGEPDTSLGPNTTNTGVTGAVNPGAYLFSILSNDNDAGPDVEVGALRFEKSLATGGYNAAFIRGYQKQVSGGDASAYIDFETRWLGDGITKVRARLGEDPNSFEVRGILRIANMAGGAAGTITLDGGQITFPASQSPSAGANVLDDYEEGTFTPGISLGGGTTGITYSVQVGAYQKVGNQVHVGGYVNLSNKGTSTGQAKLTGFPFTSANTSNLIPAVALKGIALTAISGHLQGYVEQNATTATLEYLGTGSVTNLDDTKLGNTSGFTFSASYRADN